MKRQSHLRDDTARPRGRAGGSPPLAPFILAAALLLPAGPAGAQPQEDHGVPAAERQVRLMEPALEQAVRRGVDAVEQRLPGAGSRPDLLCRNDSGARFRRGRLRPVLRCRISGGPPQHPLVHGCDRAVRRRHDAIAGKTCACTRAGDARRACTLRAGAGAPRAGALDAPTAWPCRRPRPDRTRRTVAREQRRNCRPRRRISRRSTTRRCRARWRMPWSPTGGRCRRARSTDGEWLTVAARDGRGRRAGERRTLRLRIRGGHSERAAGRPAVGRRMREPASRSARSPWQNPASRRDAARRLDFLSYNLPMFADAYAAARAAAGLPRGAGHAACRMRAGARRAGVARGDRRDVRLAGRRVSIRSAAPSSSPPSRSVSRTSPTTRCVLSS